MLHIEMTPVQQKFMKAFQVRLPGDGDRLVETEHLRHLLRVVPEGSEEAQIVFSILTAWEKTETVTVKPPTPAASKPKEPTPAWTFEAACKEAGVVDPDSEIWTDVKEVEAQLKGIEKMLSTLPRGEHNARRRLITWEKSYRVKRGRLGLAFGGEDRRGPPASYLARKAAKRANDQKVRAGMQQAKGQKKS